MSKKSKDNNNFEDNYTNYNEKTKSNLNKIANYFRGKDRLKAVKDLKTILDLKNEIIEFSTKEWEKETGYCYKNDCSVPNQYLTKNTNLLKPPIIQDIFKAFNNQTELEEKYEFYLEKDLIKKLINSNKKLIAHEFTEGNYKNKIPCVLHRQLYQSEIDGKYYIYIVDTRFYDNKPNATISLNLLVNGHTKGVCQLARIDTCGQMNPEFFNKYGLENISICDYIKSKMNTVHHNMEPDNKFKEFERSVSGEHHIHYKTPYYSLICCAAKYFNIHLQHKNETIVDEIKHCNNQKKQTQPININAYKKYNAKNIDFYNNVDNETIKNEMQKYQAVIPTSRILDMQKSLFKLDNIEYAKKAISKIDDYRTFDKNKTKINFDDIANKSILTNIDTSQVLYINSNKNNTMSKK